MCARKRSAQDLVPSQRMLSLGLGSKLLRRDAPQFPLQTGLKAPNIVGKSSQLTSGPFWHQDALFCTNSTVSVLLGDALVSVMSWSKLFTDLFPCDEQ